MYTREGCRGGRDNFKWGDIKEQDFKDREQYLGASMKVGLMAKFGKYYVHDWYAQKRDTATSIDEERRDVQQYEEELMQEALGLKPKKLLLQKKELSAEELKGVLMKESEKRADQKGREQMGPQKGTMVDDANGQEVEASILFTDARIDGLGFAAHRNAKLEKYKTDVLGTEAKLEGIKGETMKSEVKKELTEEDKLRLGPGGSASSSSASGFKKEEVKSEVKAEGAAVLKEDADAVLKAEADIKNEPADPSGSKRHREDEDPEARKRRKAEKKAKKDKKQKKAEKKAKKQVKKAAKKEKKAVKIAAKLVQARLPAKGKGGSSDSSSSSS